VGGSVYVTYPFGFIGCGCTGNEELKLKHTPSKPLAVVWASIDQILDRYRPIIQGLVTKAGQEPILPCWSPAQDLKTGCGDTLDKAFRDHVKKLAIPNVLQMPSLLLHELGSETSLINQKQDKYVTDLFSFDFHMCVDKYNILHLIN